MVDSNVGWQQWLAVRSLQFLRSLQKVLVDGTPDEFSHGGSRFLGQLQEFCDLLLFEEEGRPLHDPILSYRHTYGNGVVSPQDSSFFEAPQRRIAMGCLGARLEQPTGRSIRRSATLATT